MEKEKEKEEKGSDFRDTATHAENMVIPPENAQKEKVERAVKEKGTERTEKEKENTDGRLHRGNGDGRAVDGRVAAGLHHRGAHT